MRTRRSLQIPLAQVLFLESIDTIDLNTAYNVFVIKRHWLFLPRVLRKG
jgi:hypothetical protein